MNNRRTRLRSALAAILTVLVLVPAAVLFARVWQENSSQRDQVDLERKGVEYITALTPLVGALVESQSSALQGIKAPPESLAAAVSRVAAVDASLGADLKTRERWADLQSKISKLPSASGGPVAILQAHVDVADLTLALYGAVRRNAALNRDPDSDMANLQQAVTTDMPATMVRVSRMGDLAGILQNVTGTTRDAIAVEFSEEVLAVQDSVDVLTESLEAAVDSTDSSSLSGNLVSTLDSFRRGVETMTRGANPGGRPNTATMSTAQTSLQTSLTTLAGVVLREMDQQLDDRSDSLSYRRAEALAAGLLIVLLLVIAALWPIFGRRVEQSFAPAGSGESGRDLPMGRPSSAGPYDTPGNYGDFDPTRRERSGALR
jgi:hypothetical protein